jgi:hypothetical protein
MESPAHTTTVLSPFQALSLPKGIFRGPGMPDGQDYGWQPQAGDGQQNGQGQPSQPPRSSSSSTPAAATSSLVAKAPVATASPTIKKAATAAQTVTPSPSTPAQTTSAPPSTQAQTTAAPQRTAPSTPAQTTPAAPPASTAPARCYPLSNAGHCYEPGEFCRTSDHGKSGVAGDGEAIKCEDNDGWRWEPV